VKQYSGHNIAMLELTKCCCLVVGLAARLDGLVGFFFRELSNLACRIPVMTNLIRMQAIVQDEAGPIGAKDYGRSANV
jgi:hypothetical protein